MRSRLLQIVAVFALLLCKAALAAISAPTLTLSTTGLTVNLSWTAVTGATGYTLHYAAAPYAGPHTIASADMGKTNQFSAALWDGAAFYVTITAYDAQGSSGYSNVEYFVVKSASPPPSGLTFTANTVALPTASSDFLKTKPDGEPAMILYRQQTDKSLALEYWERNSQGQWSSELVPGAGISASLHRWGYVTGEWGGLFYTAAGEPVILNSFGSVYRKKSGQWQEVIATGAPRLNRQAAAVMGAGDVLHVMTLPFGQSGGLSYSTLNLAEAAWKTVAVGIVASEKYFATSSAPRFFDMVLDKQQKVHAVYTPEFSFTALPTGGAAVYSELWYLSNKNGAWETAKITGPAVGSYGDAGLGASIALNGSGEPMVASLTIGRAPTGSAGSAALMFHERSSSGVWASSLVANTPDGYSAGDGAIGTGFAPQLLIDAAGNPNILFTDYASQHFAGSGQDDFGGNLRLARRAADGWRVTTIVRQTDPLRNQLFWPAMTFLGNGKIAFAAQSMADTLRADLSIQSRSSGFVFTEQSP